MRLLFLAVLAAAAVAIGYPLVNEDTGDMCSALERRLIPVVATGARCPSQVLLLTALQRSFSNGTLLRTLIKQREPDLPPDIPCGVAYWRIVLDPAGARVLLEELLAAHRTDASPRGAKPLSAVASAVP